MKPSIHIASLALLAVTGGCGGGGANQDGTAPNSSNGAVITEQAATAKAANGYHAASALYGAGVEGAGIVKRARVPRAACHSSTCRWPVSKRLPLAREWVRRPRP